MTTARPVNTGSYRFVRLGDADFKGLKIRCPKGRAGSTPALGTTTESDRLNKEMSDAPPIYKVALFAPAPSGILTPRNGPIIGEVSQSLSLALKMTQL